MKFIVLETYTIKLFNLLFLLLPLILIAQNTDIRIELSENDKIVLFGDQIKLNQVGEIINKKLEKLPEEEQQVQSVTILLGATTTDEFLDLVKYEIKKTPIRFLNVQRSIISNYNQNNPITDQMMEQYNTLVKGWNAKPEHERFYRKIELDFVEGVSRRMSLKQQLQVEKLPGYLPFVKKPETVSPVAMQDFERWKFDDSYKLFVNFKEVEKNYLKDKKPFDFEKYYIMRKLINERPITEVYLYEEDLDNVMKK